MRDFLTMIADFWPLELKSGCQDCVLRFRDFGASISKSWRPKIGGGICR
jgi:hypothetical protein